MQRKLASSLDGYDRKLGLALKVNVMVHGGFWHVKRAPSNLVPYTPLANYEYDFCAARRGA